MPGLFFCGKNCRFLAREIFRAVRTKTFSTHVRAQSAPVVRKTGLFTHDRSTIPDMGPRSRGALTRNILAYLRLFAGMDFMFSKFYIFVTYSCFDYSLKEY